MSVKKSLGWMAIAQGSALFLQFGGSVVLARWLTLHETGIYAVALATAGVLSLMQALGLQALIVREETISREVTETAFTVNAVIAVVMSAAIALASYGGEALLGDAGVRRVLLVLALVPLVGIVDFLPSSFLERHGRFKQMAIVTTAASLVTTLVSVALVLNGFSYMSVAYGHVAGRIVTMLGMVMAGRTHVSFNIAFSGWRRVADFGVQMAAVSGLAALSTRLSDVLLGRFLGLEALGIYTRAAGLNGLLWNNIHLVVGRVVFVDFAEVHRRGEQLGARYLRTIEIVTATLWPAFAGLAVVSPPFIQSIFGPNWVPAAPALALLAFASIGLVAISMTWELFAATGNLRVQTRIEFIRSGLSLAAFAIGCMVSLEAAGAARVVDAAITFILYRPHVLKMTGTTKSDYPSIYLRSALLSGLAVAPSLALMAFTGWSPETSLVLIFLAILLGAVLWAAGLIFWRHPVFQEAKLIISRTPK